MIDFEQLFNSLGAEIAGNQKRLSVDSALGVSFARIQYDTGEMSLVGGVGEVLCFETDS